MYCGAWCKSSRTKMISRLVTFALASFAFAAPRQPIVPPCTRGTSITVASDGTTVETQAATSVYDGQRYRVDTYFGGSAQRMLQTSLHNATTDTLITDWLNGTVTCLQSADNSNQSQSWPQLKFLGTTVWRGDSCNSWACTNCGNAQYDLQLLTLVANNDIPVFSKFVDHTSGITAESTFVQQEICKTGQPDRGLFAAPPLLSCGSSSSPRKRKRVWPFH